MFPDYPFPCGCFLNYSSKAHAHYLPILMILRNFIHSHFISSVLRSERDSLITKASKAIIIAVKISDRKASQRQREVFS